MIDRTRILGCQWDAGNVRKNVGKDGVSQAEAEEAFFNEPLVVAADPKHSGDEIRFHALGATHSGRRLHITFTLRVDATRIRVISARDMSVKERLIYADAR